MPANRHSDPADTGSAHPAASGPARGSHSAVALLTTVLGVAYPITTHVAIARRSSALTVLAVVILAALVMIPWLASGRLLAWLVLPVIAVGCWLISDAHLALLPLYLPPVIIPSAIAWLFGRTLLDGRMPLIEQFVRAMEQPGFEPDAAIQRYARQLTSVWAAMLVSLALINLLLAAFAAPRGLLIALGFTPAVTVPQETWSLFANFIAYMVIVVFFIIEYAFRRRRFPDQPYRNFADFIRRTIAASPRLLGQQR